MTGSFCSARVLLLLRLLCAEATEPADEVLLLLVLCSLGEEEPLGRGEFAALLSHEADERALSGLLPLPLAAVEVFEVSGVRGSSFTGRLFVRVAGGDELAVVVDVDGGVGVGEEGNGDLIKR